MKYWMTALLGLLIVLGGTACSNHQPPAATFAGVVDSTASLTPSVTPTNTVEEISFQPTATPTPTVPPTPEDSPTPEQPTPTLCQETEGTIEEHGLMSEYLDATLSYLVYLPPCYSAMADRRYPVLYLIHGQGYNNSHWIDLGAVRFADQSITSGEMAAFMMVFPYDRNHTKPPAMNPFAEAVVHELIPAVDQAHRTDARRESRAIGGISRGGNWAAHMILQHPELFGAVGLHSTPIFSTDSNQEIMEWIDAIPFEMLPRIYMDSGQNDRWLRYTLIFEELLNDASIPHEWHLYPGFHDDKYWETHLPEYLRWYVSPWTN